jgi:hypothetical protein
MEFPISLMPRTGVCLLFEPCLQGNIPSTPRFPCFAFHTSMTELKFGRSSTLKDLIQDLDVFFASEVVTAEFQQDLSTCIEEYAKVHQKGEQNHESRKILEELRDVAAKNAAGGNSKLAILLKCLKELRKLLEPEDVIDIFEDTIIHPILNPFGQNRATLADAREVLLFCLLPTSEERVGDYRMHALHFRLFDIYIQKSKEVLQGTAHIATAQAMKFSITTIEKVLLDFGNKCPQVPTSPSSNLTRQEFLRAVDKYYIVKA